MCTKNTDKNDRTMHQNYANQKIMWRHLYWGENIANPGVFTPNQLYFKIKGVIKIFFSDKQKLRESVTRSQTQEILKEILQREEK